MVVGQRYALFRLFRLGASLYTPQNALGSLLTVSQVNPDADRSRPCSMALALPGSA